MQNTLSDSSKYSLFYLQIHQHLNSMHRPLHTTPLHVSPLHSPRRNIPPQVSLLHHLHHLNRLRVGLTHHPNHLQVWQDPPHQPPLRDNSKSTDGSDLVRSCFIICKLFNKNHLIIFSSTTSHFRFI